MRPVRLTWMIGGLGLVACAVIGMLRYSVPGAGSAIAVTVDVLFAAAVLLFTIGLSRDASVVARRPLGVVALLVVALWPLVVYIAQPLLPTMDATTFESGLDAYREAEGVLTAVFFVNLLVSLAAGLIAAVQILRAGIVPAPWRWAPLWALIATVAAGVLPQLLFAFGGPVGAQSFAVTALIVGMLGFLAPTLGLGILALVLASRIRSGTVEVFRSV